MDPEDARKAAEETQIEAWEFNEDTGASSPHTPLADTIAAIPLPDASSSAEPCTTVAVKTMAPRTPPVLVPPKKKPRKMLQEKALYLSGRLKETLEELDRFEDD